MTLDLRGLNPAPVTPFTEDGDVDYDAIVHSVPHWLARIFEFVDEPFDTLYASSVHVDSVNKADGMSNRTRRMVDEICMPTYRQCLAYADGGAVG